MEEYEINGEIISQFDFEYATVLKSRVWKYFVLEKVENVKIFDVKEAFPTVSEIHLKRACFLLTKEDKLLQTGHGRIASYLINAEEALVSFPRFTADQDAALRKEDSGGNDDDDDNDEVEEEEKEEDDKFVGGDEEEMKNSKKRGNRGGSGGGGVGGGPKKKASFFTSTQNSSSSPLPVQEVTSSPVSTLYESPLAKLGLDEGKVRNIYEMLLGLFKVGNGETSVAKGREEAERGGMDDWFDNALRYLEDERNLILVVLEEGLIYDARP